MAAVSPIMTFNAEGNLIAAGTSIAASGTGANIDVDFSNKFEGQIQFDVLTGGSAQAGVFATVKVYRREGTNPTADNVPITQLAIAMGSTATHFIASLALPTGKYRLTLTNGDTANAITYAATSATVDSIG